MRPSAAKTALFMLVVGSLGCHDSTAPTTGAQLRIWDVSTKLESFSQETACVPSSSSGSPYCVVSSPAGDASLSGKLVIWSTESDTVATGTFVGAFCDASSIAAGCTHVGAPVTTTLSSRYGSVEGTGAGFGRIRLLESTYPGTSEAENIQLVSDSATASTVWGHVSWARRLARNPPGYSGTFVAHRRPLF